MLTPAAPGEASKRSLVFFLGAVKDMTPEESRCSAYAEMENPWKTDQWQNGFMTCFFFPHEEMSNIIPN